MIALPVQQLRGPAGQGKQLLIHPAQHLVQAAQLVLQRIHLLDLVYFQRETGPLLPITEELAPLYPPAHGGELVRGDETGLGRAHIAHQSPALENNVQFIPAGSGGTVVRSKQNWKSRDKNDRL